MSAGMEPPSDSIEPFDPPLTDEEWEPFAAAVGIEPPFISDGDAIAEVIAAAIAVVMLDPPTPTIHLLADAIERLPRSYRLRMMDEWARHAE